MAPRVSGTAPTITVPFALCTALLFAGAFATPWPGYTQDAPVAAETTEAAAATVKTPLKGRLPDHFSKLSVSDHQRQEIYRIQAEYNTQIDALEAKIALLRKQRDNRIEALLSERQRLLLRKYRGEERANRRAKKD